MKKISSIILNALPILLMISIIPFILNDYALTSIYIGIIAISLIINRTKHDFLVLIFGFFVMTVSEYIFVSTGVETFIRQTLFGVMPLWLPFLWAYGFVAIKRFIEILGHP